MTGAEVAVLLVCVIIRAIYRLLTGAAQREQEEERRQQEERYRQEQERQRQEEQRRKIEEDAKMRFEEAVMGGRFPSEEILTVLESGNFFLPVNLKEAVEELVYGRCSISDMDWADAVALIRQRQRIEDRARKRREAGFAEPTGPVTKTEACELLGVDPGCTPEELASAYHRKVSQWHPDKLESMADELKTFATRRTARLNEAFQLLRQRA
ncbi:MAG: J domain-containing protein [Terriglobales bacterium]